MKTSIPLDTFVRILDGYTPTVMANLAGRDLRSTTGMNINYVKECAGLDPWAYGSRRLKDELTKNETAVVPAVDEWRIRYLKDLLEQRQRLHYMGDKEGEKAVTALIDSLCIN